MSEELSKNYNDELSFGDLSLHEDLSSVDMENAGSSEDSESNGSDDEQDRLQYHTISEKEFLVIQSQYFPHELNSSL